MNTTRSIDSLLESIEEAVEELGNINCHTEKSVKLEEYKKTLIDIDNDIWCLVDAIDNPLP